MTIGPLRSALCAGKPTITLQDLPLFLSKNAETLFMTVPSLSLIKKRVVTFDYLVMGNVLYLRVVIIKVLCLIKEIIQFCTTC